MTPRILPFVFAVTIAAPAVAQALPPLSQNERVWNEFLAASIGDQIRKNCPSISARWLRVLSLKNDLEAYALSLGYTDADIDALEDDEAAKTRLKAARDAYLAEHGVVAGDAESYCRLGREEIQNGTFIGSLLRD
jgi:hypothetical protein